MLSPTLLTLFVLSTFTLCPPSTTAQPVLDMDGEVAENGGTFYILPVIRGSGGGIEQAATGNETCALSVVQTRNEVSKGKPVTITSPFKSLFIPQGRVSVGFIAVPTCASTPSTWTVVEGLSEGSAVKITGYDNTLSGGFIIEQGGSIDYSYKLSFCASDTSVCQPIGTSSDGHGNKPLVLTDGNPFEFVLQKVSSSSSSACIASA
ncbi:trypsin inhibitor 1B [Cajanus cajan]|uniref:Chymotrypsin inhibitor 3 n=1 Tax=Cajanus cajan TaxID=3821 RepID=A0A151SZ05_CAJCA|nr:trypsin inhibitor 1B [Cajanus cajan]KYP60034.1 Chymotrypsin inhibitor 3 [Cajanus cajan]